MANAGAVNIVGDSRTRLTVTEITQPFRGSHLNRYRSGNGIFRDVNVDLRRAGVIDKGWLIVYRDADSIQCRRRVRAAEIRTLDSPRAPRKIGPVNLHVHIEENPARR